MSSPVFLCTGQNLFLYLWALLTHCFLLSTSLSSLLLSLSFANTPEGHRRFLEVGGTLCASGADRDQNPQSLLHPGGCFPVHRPALQQWPHGQRGKTHAGTHFERLWFSSASKCSYSWHIFLTEGEKNSSTITVTAHFWLGTTWGLLLLDDSSYHRNIFTRKLMEEKYNSCLICCSCSLLQHVFHK